MNRTLGNLTMGEFRRLQHYDGSDLTTVAEALDLIAAGDQAQAEHETKVRAYSAYVALRDRRRDDAVETAALAASRATNGGDGARMAARREARGEAHAAFELREPLLAFQPWLDAGEPETHTVRAPVNVVKRALEALVS